MIGESGVCVWESVWSGICVPAIDVDISLLFRLLDVEVQKIYYSSSLFPKQSCSNSTLVQRCYREEKGE